MKKLIVLSLLMVGCDDTSIDWQKQSQIKSQTPKKEIGVQINTTGYTIMEAEDVEAK